MIQRLFSIIGFTLLLAILMVVFGRFVYTLCENYPVIVSEQPIIFDVKPGMSLRTVVKDLHGEGYLKHPRLLIALSRMQSASHKIQAGRYEFKPKASSSQILQQLTQGNSLLTSITFIEGNTFQQMLTILNDSTDLKKEDISAFLSSLSLPQNNPEGLFFPDTYRYRLLTSDKEVLRQSYNKMQEVLNREWQSRSSDVPYQTPYEALIAASILEKEASIPEERKIISGIIIRRLQLGMYLQMDPTVVYGLGDTYTGILSRTDLLMDTPYNTYTRKGLPPTPIAMPSEDSIHAALHPEMTTYLYFVARGNGSHTFSSTLNEHVKAVEAYRQQGDKVS